MNYNHLVYFSVLAETEHYTTAAARLGISQPALSSAIRNLEDALGGVKLFEKTGRNIRLTQAGQFYREKVDESIRNLHSASIMLRDGQASAPVVIRMGVVSGTLDGLLAREIVKYNRGNQRIRVYLTESSSENLMDMVRQEKLDMAIVDTTNRDRSLHFRKLCQRDFCVALPAEHPLSGEESLSPGQLAGYPQVVFHTDMENSFAHWANHNPAEENNLCTVNTAQAALELVAAGAGFCIAPIACIQRREDVTFLPLQNRHQALYMCILYDKWLEPPVWGFVEQLVKLIRKNAQAAE